MTAMKSFSSFVPQAADSSFSARLRALLAKDLRRAWRNPLPWLIHLIVPLAMTALLGLVFGGKSDHGALGQIRFAVVDEDRSLLSAVLRGAADQHQDGGHLEPVFLDRAAAMQLVNAGKISAVLIIHTNFMRDYLAARDPVSLELIKNPAESIHPAVVEELLGALATGLNAVSRNFLSDLDLSQWQAVALGRADYSEVAAQANRVGHRLRLAAKIVYPPIIGYESRSDEGATNPVTSGAGHATQAGNNDRGSLFAYLLVGLSGMFLLFLGQNAMTDLHRELRAGTFERYQTLCQPLWPFLLGKMMFAVVVLLLGSAVLLGGGGLVFRIHWQHLLALAALVLGYAGFVAAFFAVLVALVPDERRARVLNNLAGMALGIVGGCTFPPEQLPAFLRDHVTPLMPSHWFVEGARQLQFAGAGAAWGEDLFGLVAGGLVLAALSAVLFRRRFQSGVRA
jgi:ABC-2 type transport system permease protein